MMSSVTKRTGRRRIAMTQPLQVVVVTGAGGSGCGRAIASRFAKDGAAVVISDINDAGGAETAQLIADNGGRAAFCHADVRDETQVRALIGPPDPRLERAPLPVPARQGRCHVENRNTSIDQQHERPRADRHQRPPFLHLASRNVRHPPWPECDPPVSQRWNVGGSRHSLG